MVPRQRNVSLIEIFIDLPDQMFGQANRQRHTRRSRPLPCCAVAARFAIHADIIVQPEWCATHNGLQQPDRTGGSNCLEDSATIEVRTPGSQLKLPGVGVAGAGVGLAKALKSNREVRPLGLSVKRAAIRGSPG